MTESEPLTELHNNCKNSRRRPSTLEFSCSKPVTKAQDYSPFRSSAYQQKVTYCRSNSNQSYTRNQSCINSESNIQEYFRYRNAKDLSSIKTPTIEDQISKTPSYLSIKMEDKNDYSRYKNSQYARRSSMNGFRIRQSGFHKKCRTGVYHGDAKRFPVPDDKVCWNVQFPDYQPLEFTTEKVKHNPKADSCDPSNMYKFNQIDGKVDRRSFIGPYFVDPTTNRPQNPVGRTGVTGRGRLYYWGPNHAGDSLITRWLRDDNGKVVHRTVGGESSWKPVLEFVTIRRKDTKQWALPGGMVDPGEHISETVKREFQEEAMQDGVDPALVNQLFSKGRKVYESYVDDPRNTDNAWIETVAINYHDETGELTKCIGLNAGDDAEKVLWCPVDRSLDLYACHKDILKKVVDRLDAYW